MTTKEQIIKDVVRNASELEKLSKYRDLCEAIIVGVGMLNDLWHIEGQKVDVQSDIIAITLSHVPGVMPYNEAEPCRDRMAFYRTMNNATLLKDAIDREIIEIALAKKEGEE